MMTRILFSDNGVLADISTALDDYKNGTKALTIKASEDCIYIGAYYPFNSKFFKMSVVATVESIPSVKYWTGSNGWKDAVEVIDETNGFKNNGFISWTPNRDNGWSREDTDDISELNSKMIYDLFWMKLSFSADTVINFSWIGELFSNDDDLGAEFPDLMRTQTLDSFETAKTNWEHQHVIAGKIIVDDLKSKKIISHKEQILDRKELTLASVQKCASIIYSSFGDDFENNKKNCELEYQKRIKKDIFNIDKDETALPTVQTLSIRQGRLYR